MNRVVYCAKCGKALPIYRKALPQFGRIIEIVEPHKCGTKVEEPDFGTPIGIPTKMNIEKEENKFVRKLNDLTPAPLRLNEPGDKRDKKFLREEVITSTAPASLMKNIKNLTNMAPKATIEDPESED